MFWENLSSYVVIERLVGEKPLDIIIEQTRDSYCHACTANDLTRVLSSIPHGDKDLIDFIVLRQPKRKEEILAPCWGRVAFSAEVGRFTGAAIILEAHAVGSVVRWPKSLSTDQQDELNRLRGDGHQVKETSKAYLLHTTIESVRATQLYRTLLHEIGHLIDYRRRPWQVWGSKPVKEKEAFAHRYSDSIRWQLLERGVIPFDSISDADRSDTDGDLP